MSKSAKSPRLNASDWLALAKLCRTLVKARYPNVTTCIETSFLLERAAVHLGFEVQRAVCRAVAFSPLMAQALEGGQEMKGLTNKPGHWAVAVGVAQFPGDYVGRSEPERNRYVGHVVCLAGGLLIDPSVDQMSRPDKGLVLDEPIVCELEEGPVSVGQTLDGAVVQYTLHREVPPPKPVTDRILERLAKGLAKSMEEARH